MFGGPPQTGIGITSSPFRIKSVESVGHPGFFSGGARPGNTIATGPFGNQYSAQGLAGALRPGDVGTYTIRVYASADSFATQLGYVDLEVQVVAPAEPV